MPTQIGTLVELTEKKSDLWGSMGDKKLLRSSKPMLVAEDTLELQKVIAMQLKKLGITHHIVNDGLAAIEAYMKNEYSMIGVSPAKRAKRTLRTNSR